VSKRSRRAEERRAEAWRARVEPPRPGQGRGPQRSWRPSGAVGALLVGAGAIGLVAWWLAVRPPRRADTPELAAGPEAALVAAREAYGAGRYRDAVDAYLVASHGGAIRTWEDHYDHAASLHDLTVAYRQVAGQQVALTYSSVERVTLFKRELEELELALEQAPPGAARAKVLKTRAEALFIWGLPWEAFISFRGARLADPSDSAAGRKADNLLDPLAGTPLAERGLKRR